MSRRVGVQWLWLVAERRVETLPRVTKGWFLRMDLAVCSLAGSYLDHQFVFGEFLTTTGVTVSNPVGEASVAKLLAPTRLPSVLRFSRQHLTVFGLRWSFIT